MLGKLEPLLSFSTFLKVMKERITITIQIAVLVVIINGFRDAPLSTEFRRTRVF